MFAQKKKKSKIWIAVPVILALGVGLWLNAGLKDDTGEESIPTGSDQYEEDISDLAGLSDTLRRTGRTAQDQRRQMTADMTRIPMIFLMTSAAITAAAA